MKIVIGLGNPGRQYEKTRHNVGFAVVDELARGHNIEVIRLKHRALVGDKSVHGQKLMLAKPQTFMNLSGECVREVLNFYKVEPSDIIIIYDDTALPLGAIRVRESGTDGGHNGIKSIISHIGKEFPRVRIGIGEKPQQYDLADYVTSKFFEDEIVDIERAVKDAAACVDVMLKDGIQKAMNRYNKRIENRETNVQ